MGYQAGGDAIILPHKYCAEGWFCHLHVPMCVNRLTSFYCCVSGLFKRLRLCVCVCVCVLFAVACACLFCQPEKNSSLQSIFSPTAELILRRLPLQAMQSFI